MRKTRDYHFELPEARIAQAPAEPRSAAKLLVVGENGLSDRRIADLAEILPERAVLVVNDTRVLPARLSATKASGGAVELVALEPAGENRWRCLARASKALRDGAELSVAGAAAPLIVRGERDADGILIVEFPGEVEAFLERHGALPIPPYLRRAADARDRERYQTVFAEVPGAVAAPTAGLHFSREHLARLEAGGITVARVTLHVGLGTFAPVRAASIDDHKLHAERFDIPEATAELIASGRPVVAVGTTSVRALESAAVTDRRIRPGAGVASLFITPGYRFQIIDHLLTNFPSAGVDPLDDGLRLRGLRDDSVGLPPRARRRLPLLQLWRCDVSLATGGLVSALPTPGFSFEVLAKSGRARAGVLRTPRGDIPTPVFMPVGTLGTVKAMTVTELEGAPLDARIILGNTYHLYLRPGLDVLRAHGGLHAFSGWSRPILTDSGGFRSLASAPSPPSTPTASASRAISTAARIA